MASVQIDPPAALPTAAATESAPSKRKAPSADTQQDESADADTILVAPIPGISAGLAEAPPRLDEAAEAGAAEAAPRKRARKSTAKAGKAATTASGEEADAAPAVKTPRGRRKKSAAAAEDSAGEVVAAAPIRKPRMSRSKSAPTLLMNLRAWKSTLMVQRRSR